ncbi:acyl carrier protein [Aestuariivirga sp.]|uniref:acyl carrier protein n=1 Tax=Aestuariivirga sp. TaxID=2650926 RepID=UPI003594116B
MSARLTIISEIEQVAKDQNKTLRPLTDDLELLESGLDSLCFAILVARLEDKVGYDPFTMSDDIEFPVTLGEFISVYDNVKLAA